MINNIPPKNLILILAVLTAIMCCSPWVASEKDYYYWPYHRGDHSWSGTEFSWGKTTFAVAVFIIVLCCLDMNKHVASYPQLILAGAIALLACLLFFYMEAGVGLFSGHVRWRGKYKVTTLPFLLTVALASVNLYVVLTKLQGGGRTTTRRAGHR
jgi:hypothetical protein